MRAISVLLVITYHTRGYHLLWLHGDNGVTVFFVISGFLITTLLVREERVRGAISLRAFYVRRAFRILPMYFPALGVYCFLILGATAVLRAATLEPGGADPSGFRYALPYYLLYFQEIPNFVHPGLPFSLSWSLGFEEKFYLAWPLIAFVLLRALRVGAAMALVLAVAFAAASVFLAGGVFVGSYAHILCGCLLALLLSHQPWFDRLRVLGRGPVLMGLIVIGVILNLLFEPLDSQYLLLTITIALAVAGMVVAPASFVSQVLATRFMVLIGRLSYGIYLFHHLSLHVAERFIPAKWGLAGDMATLVLGLTLTGGITYVLHRTVELPLIATGHRISLRLRGAPAEKATTG